MKKLLFVLLGLTNLNICVANPTYDVTKGALQNDPGLCQYGYNPNCVSSRQHQRNQPTEIVHIKVPSKYGAWAVNLKTGISGGALEMDSLAAAKKEAIKTCERNGSNKPCEVKAWVRNGCIAVAQRKDGKAFFGITSPGLAETEALRKCQASGGIQCEITTPEGCSMPKF
ncbi:DUF4189 domain-containing protein [Neisseria cinerea]|jgi:hypothetical protein|uniref:DUF4189 domain-containing protein n=1 Tax=Neisseria cinerea TaxID=483 RepID=UPI000D3A027D|nr:DUF4189 domain-containing protein [Neisseria cinerea]